MKKEFPIQDNKARELGAVSYHDDLITKKSPYYSDSHWHFARYYFNNEGKEIAYFIPDLSQFKPEDMPLHIHETPREWGIEHYLEKL